MLVWMSGCLLVMSSCHFINSAASPSVLTAQTIGCSCANIHADYYFISKILTDDRHFRLNYARNTRLNLTKVVCF